jgi:MoaA/NifB/PqqE/SkfB family radical SAM enzyme
VLNFSFVFAIRKLTISLVLHEFVYVVNVVHKDLIKSHGGEMTIVMEEFQTWCGFPSMQGTIDDIHVSIVKPQGSYEEDKYYRKTGGYSIVVQAIVHCHKKILDVVVFDFLGSVNDSQILHKLAL